MAGVMQLISCSWFRAAGIVQDCADYIALGVALYVESHCAWNRIVRGIVVGLHYADYMFRVGLHPVDCSGIASCRLSCRIAPCGS